MGIFLHFLNCINGTKSRNASHMFVKESQLAKCTRKQHFIKHTRIGKHQCMSIWKFHIPEAFSEPCQTFKMEPFVKIVNYWKLLTIFTKTSSYMFNRILNVPLFQSLEINILSGENPGLAEGSYPNLAWNFIKVKGIILLLNPQVTSSEFWFFRGNLISGIWLSQDQC